MDLPLFLCVFDLTWSPCVPSRFLRFCCVKLRCITVFDSVDPVILCMSRYVTVIMASINLLPMVVWGSSVGVGSEVQLLFRGIFDRDVIEISGVILHHSSVRQISSDRRT